ncbi:MAG TPA: phosphoenolpyruvate--protein phosphotransferase, partial [Clostridiales bacterium UBA8153]|nr:phosphoenolpyruvate--protein phosphotransferase [Clostridiales bacterium UBA8153]
RIRDHLEAPAGAVLAVAREQAAGLQALDDEYLSQRSQDVLDVFSRLARAAGGGPAGTGEFPPGPGSVVVAADLTPSETAGMRLDYVSAVVLAGAGRTSHTAILARSLGIPAVVALGDVTAIAEGVTLSVDGSRGTVVVNPGAEDTAAGPTLQRDRTVPGSGPAVTTDGCSVALWANISGPGEVAAALRWGAEGVGLFRTEFLFAGRTQAPSEEEQFSAYRAVLLGMGGCPVIIRTLDVGGDKDLPYLDLGQEANPFLGRRAVRLCLDRPALFQTQLRALVRSAPYGDLRVMFPMISSVEELLACREAVQEAQRQLARLGVAVEQVPLGIMVETPAAAVMAGELARHCDFFSLGTNDLTQYTLAVDRGNPRVSALYDPFHPAVLRLMARTIEHGHQAGLDVSVCGELAGETLAVPLLVGLGIDELSMAPSSIPAVRSLIQSLAMAEARELACRALGLGRAEEIRAMAASRFPVAATPG